MNKVISKKGISLVALVITIIVLIILTAAVVVTGINTPKNTEYAIKMHNHAAVQDAVTLYIMTSMLDGMDNYDPSYSGAYTVKDVDDIVPELYNVTNKQWTENAVERLGINLTQEELQAVFTLDSKGVVGWVAGQEPTLETDENNQQQPTKTLSSIAITTEPTTKEYEVGDTVDMTGLVVTATYSDNSTANVTSSVTYTPALTEVTQTPGTKEITVTYSEKTATEKITITVVEATTATTLGSLITGPSMYGTTVTGYNGNGITSWQVLYKQRVGTEDYVYIIPTSQTAYTALTLYSGSNASSIISNAKTYFGLSNDFDTVGTNNENYKATLWLLDTSVWATYKDSNLGDNVVGVIGSPTMEMMVASYNDKNAGVSGFTNLSYTVDSFGYSDPGVFSGEPYITGDYYWLACPSCFNADFVRYASDDGAVGYDDYYGPYNGLRPVVCLKSNIPATMTDGVIDI